MESKTRKKDCVGSLRDLIVFTTAALSVPGPSRLLCAPQMAHLGLMSVSCVLLYLITGLHCRRSATMTAHL